MTPTTQPAEHTKATVPPNYRLAEEIFASIEEWQADQITFHPTDIFQIIERHRAGIPAPESAIEQAREALKEALAYVEAVPQGWAWQAHRECLQQQLTAALTNLTPATDKQG